MYPIKETYEIDFIEIPTANFKGMIAFSYSYLSVIA